MQIWEQITLVSPELKMFLEYMQSEASSVYDSSYSQG